MTKNVSPALAVSLVILSMTFLPARSVAELRNAARAVPTPLRSVRTTRKPVVAAKKKGPMRVHAQTAAYHLASRITPALQSLLDATSMETRHRRMVESVLGLLPPSCQNALESFSVLYDRPKHRGLAGRGVVLVSGAVPDTEFIGLLLHEALGHFRDITCITGTPHSGASAFRDGQEPVWNDDPSAAFYRISWQSDKELRGDSRAEDFVTGYARKGDSFEDLAESVTYYMSQEEAFRLRAQSNTALARKLAWLETHMSKTGRVADGESWNGEIAWDATKLAFTWLGQ